MHGGLVAGGDGEVMVVALVQAVVAVLVALFVMVVLLLKAFYG